MKIIPSPLTTFIPFNLSSNNNSKYIKQGKGSSAYEVNEQNQVEDIFSQLSMNNISLVEKYALNPNITKIDLCAFEPKYIQELESLLKTDIPSYYQKEFLPVLRLQENGGQKQRSQTRSQNRFCLCLRARHRTIRRSAHGGSEGRHARGAGVSGRRKSVCRTVLLFAGDLPLADRGVVCRERRNGHAPVCCGTAAGRTDRDLSHGGTAHTGAGAAQPRRLSGGCAQSGGQHRAQIRHPDSDRTLRTLRLS